MYMLYQHVFCVISRHEGCGTLCEFHRDFPDLLEICHSTTVRNLTVDLLLTHCFKGCCFIAGNDRVLQINM